MPNLATRPESVLDAIRTLNNSVHSHPELANRMAHGHAFYVLEDEERPPLFGFSKFIGYDGLRPEEYLRESENLNGRDTEKILAQWFEEVRYGTRAYRELLRQLSAWLAEFGKRPREGGSQKVRLMVLRPEYREANSRGEEDRRLLELMLAVADLLPVNQRLELRAVL